MKRANGNQERVYSEFDSILKYIDEYIIENELDDEQILIIVNKTASICQEFNNMDVEDSQKNSINNALQNLMANAVIKVKEDNAKETLAEKIDFNNQLNINYTDFVKSFNNEKKRIEHLGQILNSDKGKEKINSEDLELMMEELKDSENLSDFMKVLSKEQVQEVRAIQKEKLLSKITLNDVPQGNKIIVSINNMNDDLCLNVSYDFGNGVQSSLDMDEEYTRKAGYLYRKAYSTDKENEYIKGNEQQGAEGCKRLLDRLQMGASDVDIDIPIYFDLKNGKIIKYNQYDDEYLGEEDFTRYYARSIIEKNIDEAEEKIRKDKEESEQILEDFFCKDAKEFAQGIEDSSNSDPDEYIRKIGKTMDTISSFINTQNLTDFDRISVLNELENVCTYFNSNSDISLLTFGTDLEGDEHYSIGGWRMKEIVMNTALAVESDSNREKLLSKYNMDYYSSKDYIMLAKAFKSEDKKIECLKYAIDFEMNEGDLSDEDINDVINSINDTDKKIEARNMVKQEKTKENPIDILQEIVILLARQKGVSDEKAYARGVISEIEQESNRDENLLGIKE